jgi:hypothetical protein
MIPCGRADASLGSTPAWYDPAMSIEPGTTWEKEEDDAGWYRVQLLERRAELQQHRYEIARCTDRNDQRARSLSQVYHVSETQYRICRLS